jgi:uncharacterized membrane protein (UPF0127 family)
MRGTTLLGVVLVLAGCSTNSVSADRRGRRRGQRDVGGERVVRSDAATHRASSDAATPAAPDGAPSELDGRVVLRGADGEVEVRVEVVKKRAQRSRGLMYRERLDEDAGMIFLFREPEHQTFWMRNTLIPLDMIFIGSDKRVVGVYENAQPRTDRTRAVDGDSQYVLEVNAGFARRWGIGPGSRVELHGIDETGVDP